MNIYQSSLTADKGLLTYSSLDHSDLRTLVEQQNNGNTCLSSPSCACPRNMGEYLRFAISEKAHDPTPYNVRKDSGRHLQNNRCSKSRPLHVVYHGATIFILIQACK